MFPRYILNINGNNFRLRDENTNLKKIHFISSSNVILPNNLIRLNMSSQRLLRNNSSGTYTVISNVPRITKIFILTSNLRHARHVIRTKSNLLRLYIRRNTIDRRSSTNRRQLILNIRRKDRPMHHPYGKIKLTQPNTILSRVILPNALLPRVYRRLTRRIRLIMPKGSRNLTILRTRGLLRSIRRTILLRRFFPRMNNGMTIKIK